MTLVLPAGLVLVLPQIINLLIICPFALFSSEELQQNIDGKFVFLVTLVVCLYTAVSWVSVMWSESLLRQNVRLSSVLLYGFWMSSIYFWYWAIFEARLHEWYISGIGGILEAVT